MAYNGDSISEIVILAFHGAGNNTNFETNWFEIYSRNVLIAGESGGRGEEEKSATRSVSVLRRLKSAIFECNEKMVRGRNKKFFSNAAMKYLVQFRGRKITTYFTHRVLIYN